MSAGRQTVPVAVRLPGTVPEVAQVFADGPWPTIYYSVAGSHLPDERGHEFTRELSGWVTDTDRSSTDAVATRRWCADVLGWTFQPAIPTPSGDYHLFAYSEAGGGGIRQVVQDEVAGSTPTVHVENAQETDDAALAAGAESVSPPAKIMEGVCTACSAPLAAC
jgi:predicted enzyme related to lactoylglutathione lyase